MKKSVLTIACIIVTVISYGQHGNSDTDETTESYGLKAGTSGAYNNYFGSYAGEENAGDYNVFIGFAAGKRNKGVNCVFIGHESGLKNIDGSENTFLGHQSGHDNTSGKNNTYIGTNSGFKSQGTENVHLGSFSGSGNGQGSQNTFLGTSAGGESTGSGNVFIGYNSGLNEQGNEKLHIDNHSTDKPLIYGDFNLDFVTFNGNVGIGTDSFFDSVDNYTYALSVEGGIRAHSVKVYTTWADFVFEENYTLPTLEEVENFILNNGHLKDIPSAKEVEASGIELGEMNKLLLQKIEELTLYTIEQEKRLQAIEALLTTKQ